MALTVLDASVLIAFLDRSDVHHEAAAGALAARRSDELVVPSSVYAEALVGPLRRGKAAVEKLDSFFADFGMRIEPLSAQIARRAATLRARTASLRLPDAFVLATGDVLEADAVLTADRAWARVSRRARSI